MVIEPYKNYVIYCKDSNKIEYRWNLNVKPGSNSWKIVNQSVEAGIFFKDYFILSITEFFTDQFSVSTQDEFPISTKCISRNEFDYAIDTSNFEYAVRPSYSQSYRCQICDGIVANSRCANCMFDWDS